MKRQFITNGIDEMFKITDESPTHYICGKRLFAKSDIITESNGEDLTGKWHLLTFTLPFIVAIVDANT